MSEYVYLVESTTAAIPSVRKSRGSARNLARILRNFGHKVTITQIKLTEENVKVVR